MRQNPRNQTVTAFFSSSYNHSIALLLLASTQILFRILTLTQILTFGFRTYGFFQFKNLFLHQNELNFV